MAIKKDNLDHWFENSLDVDNRTIYMGSIDASKTGEETGTDAFMAEYFIKGMRVLQCSKPKENITIIMNNVGGDWYHGMAIYDAIKTCSCHCTIIVYGQAFSMGSVILQAADVRVMMPNSRAMIHYGTEAIDNHAKIAYRWADEGKIVCHQMENIYLHEMLEKEEKMGPGYMAKALTKIVQRQKQMEYSVGKMPDKPFSFSSKNKQEEMRIALKELLNFDTILTAEETVAIGLADEVFERPGQ